MKKIALFKKISVAVIVLSFVFQVVGPLAVSVQAQEIEAQGVGSVLTSAASCAAGGFLGTFLTSLISNKLNDLLGSLSKRISKWFSLADEVPIHNQKQWTKENVLDLIARCGARAILNDMTNRTIGAVRTGGREGGPSFVRNWKDFLAKAEYRGENIFRSILASATNICPHVSGTLRNLYGVRQNPHLGPINTRIGNLNPYGARARCTMPDGWNMAKYSLDFVGNGGWEALVKLAEPQNNLFGSILMSQNELAAQRGQSRAEDTLEALTGGGFTSRRGQSRTSLWLNQGVGFCSNNSSVQCTNNTPCLALPSTGFCSNEPSVQCTDNAPCLTLPDDGGNNQVCIKDAGAGQVCVIRRNTCLARGSNGQCLVENDILTPGSTLGQSVGAVINQEMAWITNIDEMEELMANLTDVLLRRILNLSEPDVSLQENFRGDPYPPFRKDPDIGSLPDPSLPPPTVEPTPPGPTPTPILPPTVVEHQEQCSGDSNGNGEPDICISWDVYVAGGACEQATFGVGPCIVVNHNIDPLYMGHINSNGGYLAYINDNTGAVFLLVDTTTGETDGTRCLKDYPAGPWSFRINLDGTGQGLMGQSLNPPTASAGTNGVCGP